MRIEELIAKLNEMEVYVTPKTLRLWGKKRIIPDHEVNIGRTGRGNAENWSETALEEAAAILALQQQGLLNRKALTKAKIDEIKKFAARVYASPNVCHVIHEIKIVTPGPIKPITFGSQFTMVVNDKALNEMVITWISAVEKTRYNLRISKRPQPRKRLRSIKTIPKPAIVVFKWRSNKTKLQQLEEELSIASLKFRLLAAQTSKKTPVNSASQELKRQFEAAKTDFLKLKSQAERDPFFKLSSVTLKNSYKDNELSVFYDDEDSWNKAFRSLFESHHS